MKAKARRIMRVWFGQKAANPDPRHVGRNASTHCRPCGCFMCREHKDVAPMRERRFDDPDLQPDSQ